MIILSSLLLTAQAAAGMPDCADPQVQSEMNICAHREWEQADAELNALWPQVRAMMQREDGYAVEDDQPGYWESLLAAQRAWIAYRDAHCRLSSYDARGGTMQPLLHSTCMTVLTERRTEELHELTRNQMSGEAKPGTEN